MKKILVLFSTFFALITNGQTYYSFPDSNAVWNFQRVWYCWAGVPSPVSESYSITFSGDTIISSQTYHKLNVPFLQTPMTSCGPGTTAINTYKGAIRQDTIIKKVFFVPPSDTVEQLLYDFNMQVGDTVKGYIEAWAYPIDTVQSIDSVLVGSTFRKRWNINFGYDIHIIEGIGSTYGLIEHSPGNQPDWYEYSITCFQQDGQPLYPATSTTCQLITGTNSIDKFSAQIKVFPNPSLGSFTIDFDKLTIKEMRLTDILGNVVFKQRNFEQTKINIDKLPSGTYILTIIDKNDKQTNSKIISSP